MQKEISNLQLWSLVLARLLVGWHFLFEGMAKVLNPSWTSLPYLMDSQGIFSKMYLNLAANPSLLATADFLNKWGLVLVGLGLILGLFTRWATIGAMLMLVLYLMSHPSFITAKYALPSEGSYLWIDKNVIELSILLVLLVFPTGHRIGIDRLLAGRKK